MRELTAKQKKVLAWVQAFKARHGLPPTVREIGGHFGMASSSVFGHLKLIEKKGFLRRGKLGARSLEFAGSAAPSASVAGEARSAGAVADADVLAVPLVGRVAAGTPLLAAENADGEVRVDRAMLAGAGSARHFALKVVGDSMVGAGILDGDTVIAREQQTAEDGRIVVALLEDEATVKYLHREPGRVRLQPANPRMKPIYSKEVAIQGVVVGVLRTYS